MNPRGAVNTNESFIKHLSNGNFNGDYKTDFLSVNYVNVVGMICHGVSYACTKLHYHCFFPSAMRADYVRAFWQKRDRHCVVYLPIG